MDEPNLSSPFHPLSPVRQFPSPSVSIRDDDWSVKILDSEDEISNTESPRLSLNIGSDVLSNQLSKYSG